MKKTLSWTLLLAAALLAGCCQTTPEAKPELTAQDSGKTFELQRDESARLLLRQNATTGYLWHFRIEGAKSAIRVTNTRNIPEQTDPKMVGAPTRLEVTVTAQEPGASWLIGEYKRSWEKDVPPQETVRYRFEVKHPGGVTRQ